MTAASTSPAPFGGHARRTPLASAAVAAAVLGLAVLTLSVPTASAANVSISLYGAFAGGWSFTPGTETNPGPTISVNTGDVVAVHLVGDDLAYHGLFIDFNDNGRIDGGDYSSITGTDVSFTFTVPSAPGSHHYYCSIHSPNANGDYLPGAPMYGIFVVNQKPFATFVSPTAGMAWTGGTAHNVVFNLADQEPPTNLTVWVNYSYNGGARTGAIAGPVAGTLNPNVVGWTPPPVNATDTKIVVSAVDRRGLSGSSVSSPFEIDSSAPTVTAQSPAPNAVGVTLNTKIRVTWSEMMNETASGASNTFAVRRVSDGVWIPGTSTWSPDGTLMTFTPNAMWTITTTFEVDVNATARDDSDPGNAFVGPTAWQFTTGTVVDGTPPVIVNAAASPATQVAAGSVTIFANVTDDLAVGSVSVQITGPSTDVNLTMTNSSGTWIASRGYTLTGTYGFTVWALDTSGNAASRTGSFSISQGAPPPAPASVTAHPLANGTIMVMWSAVTGGNVAGYNVYRATSVGGPFAKLTATSVSASGPLLFFDKNVQAGVAYYYVVTSVDATGTESAHSAPALAAVAAPTPPAAPDYTLWILAAGVFVFIVIGLVAWRQRKKR